MKNKRENWKALALVPLRVNVHAVVFQEMRLLVQLVMNNTNIKGGSGC